MSLKGRIASLIGIQSRAKGWLAESGSASSNLQALGFDAAYYLRAYSDVKAAKVNPEQHYLTTGWKEGRNPSADFDTVFYRSLVCGATDPDLCPLVHFNMRGRAAGAPRTRAEALAMGGYTPAAADLIRALPDLSTYFDAGQYVERYPSATLTDLSPLEHYLTRGWRMGFAASDGFDTAFYRETFLHNDAADICPLVHFICYGRKAGLPTTRDEARSRTLALLDDRAADSSIPLLARLDRETVTVLTAPQFDSEYYLATYPDVIGAGVAAWWHYVNCGWIEGREPSPHFNARWYAKDFMPQESLAKLPPLLHYATLGRMARRPASEAMTLVQLERTRDSAFGDSIRMMMSVLGFDLGSLNFDRVRRFVLPLFSAPVYRKARGLDDSVSTPDALLRYLWLDFSAGMPPGPMFSPTHYLAEVARVGVTPPRPHESPLHHWLRIGVDLGLSPMPGFDPEEYLALNPDLNGYGDNLFGHFIQHGQHENRRFSRLTPVAPSQLARLSGDLSTSARVFCEAMATRDGKRDFRQMQDFLTSGRMVQMISAAAAIEPDIGGLDRNHLSLLPPWHDQTWMEFRQILRLMPEGQFDSVVLMPFCKLGGADFVAGVLTSALSATGRVLVLRTDADDWARPDWFPETALTVDLSAHMAGLEPPIRMRMLYELLAKLRPASVYNVNSSLGFDTIVRYGERLALLTRLHAYYFCADRTTEGVETGYPIWYFSNILPHLTGAMIDNRALAEQLIARYSLSGPYRDRVRLFYTPAMSTFPDRTIAEAQQAETTCRMRKRVLWAGRLDAQKRFNLVQDIARLLPEVDFDCWGQAVLDAPPDLSSLPPNLRVHPPFKTYEELPLAQSDGWLYTSGWDGMPTILIELAAMGVPIVASAVGGVPELIDETTGWPLDEKATAEDYANAVEAMLNAPDQRIARAAALQAHAKTQHNRDNYAAALAAMAAFGSTANGKGA